MDIALISLWIVRILGGIALGGLGYLSTSSPHRHQGWVLATAAVSVLLVSVFDVLVFGGNILWLSVPYGAGLAIGHMARKPRV